MGDVIQIVTFAVQINVSNWPIAGNMSEIIWRGDIEMPFNCVSKQPLTADSCYWITHGSNKMWDLRTIECRCPRSELGFELGLVELSVLLA